MSASVFSMSVDDGHPLDLRMAALLQSHQIKAAFYLPISNQEGWPVMSPAAIRELAQGSRSARIRIHTAS